MPEVEPPGGAVWRQSVKDDLLALFASQGSTVKQPLPLEKELLPVGGLTILDAIRVNAAGQLVEVLLYCSTQYTSQGVFVVDIALNGNTILVSPFDGKTVPARPNSAVILTLASTVTLAIEDTLTITTTSASAPLAGSGLTAVLKTQAI